MGITTLRLLATTVPTEARNVVHHLQANRVAVRAHQQWR